MLIILHFQSFKSQLMFSIKLSNNACVSVEVSNLNEGSLSNGCGNHFVLQRNKYKGESKMKRVPTTNSYS